MYNLLMSIPMSSSSSTGRACVALHCAVFLFGLAGVFGKFLHFSPFFVVFSRAAIASILILGLRFLRGHTVRIARQQIPALLASGVLLSVHWVTFFYSIQVSTIAIGLLSYSAFPLFATFLEPICSRQRLSLRSVAVAAVIFIGLLIIVPRFDFNDHATQGVFWGAVSGLAFALLSIVNRKQVQRLSPQLAAMWQNAIAALLLAPLITNTSWSSLSAEDVFLLVLLGAVFTAFAHSLFIFSLVSLTAQFASVIAALEPVYGIVFGYVFAGEIPALRTLLGGALIVVTTVVESYLVARRK